MRAVILNGARRDDEGLTPVAQSLNTALAARGWEVKHILLRDRTIAYCQGCFECWVKTPGLCKTKDEAQEVTRALIQSDLLVLLSPVTFGGYSSELKKALDRSIGIVSPSFTRIQGEVHHRRRYTRYPALLAVGVMAEPDADEERLFTALAGRNAINFHAPVHAAGVVYRGQQAERMWAAIGRLVAQITQRHWGAA
jgi:multimeric flavodoxin WrbA